MKSIFVILGLIVLIGYGRGQNNKRDMVRIGPPTNVTVITSDTEVIVQWNEPDIDDQEFYKNPDNVTAPPLESVGLDYEQFMRRIASTIKRKLNLGDILTGHFIAWKDFFTPSKKKEYVVPRSQAKIGRYVVVVSQPNKRNSTQQIETPPDLTEVKIINLIPLMSYSVRVEAVFTNSTVLSSTPILFTTASTHGYSNHSNVCMCDKFGRDPRQPMCNPDNDRPCKCRAGYTGPLCERCVAHYYRISPNRPCHQCPCNPEHSDGRCRIDRKGAWCLDCNRGYIGKLCHLCKHNYYPHYGHCRECECNGHNDPVTPHVCSMDEGVCYKCIHNTTGDHCEDCLDGFGRDVSTGHCYHHHDIKSSASSGHSTGTIAAICVMTILVISIIVGLIVYRCYKAPLRRQFWTVEVRGAPEGVSFSDLAHEDYAGRSDVGKPLEDLSFRKSSHKAYSLLHEDI